MKRRFFAVPMLLAVLSCAISCSKQGFTNFEDSYSYKISGKLVLLPDLYADSSAVVQDSNKIEIPLKAEQGQMRVFDEGDGNVTLTFNDVFGNVTVSKAVLQDDRIVLAENQEKLVELDELDLNGRRIYVTYSGEGRNYDSAVIFDLRYDGKVTYRFKEMTIVDSKIECVAVEND